MRLSVMSEAVTVRLAGAVGPVAAVFFDPVEEKAHQVASGQDVALAVLRGVHYTFKVLVEDSPGVFAGNHFDVAEVGLAASCREPLHQFPDLLLAELGVTCHGLFLLKGVNERGNPHSDAINDAPEAEENQRLEAVRRGAGVADRAGLEKR
jgi:hypothetical protein